MNQIEKRERIATLQQAVFEGQYRLKSKKNSIGESLSSLQLKAMFLRDLIEVFDSASLQSPENIGAVLLHCIIDSYYVILNLWNICGAHFISGSSSMLLRPPNARAKSAARNVKVNKSEVRATCKIPVSF